MGYAIKVKNVNFSSVALDTVNYVEEVPCTALSFDVESLSFERAEETKTITATKTPQDTTDELFWSSSNENVATVNDGVVTIHGIGTATITATCGEITKSITITQTTIKAQYDFSSVSGKYPEPTGNDQSEIRSLKLSSVNNQYAVGQAYHASNNGLHIWNSSDIECIRVPYGATKVYFAIASGETDFTVSYMQFGTTDGVTLSDVQCTKYLKSETSVSAATGKAVEYGQCFALRVLAAQYDKMGDYAYFT